MRLNDRAIYIDRGVAKKRTTTASQKRQIFSGGRKRVLVSRPKRRAGRRDADPPAAMGRLGSGNVRARIRWCDDARDGALVIDEPVVVHCYTTPFDIEDAGKLAEIGRFCRKMGLEAHQGEIGLVVGDEYFAIHDFAEE